MTLEEAAEFMENREYVSGQKNRIRRGLSILEKYSEDVTLTAEHDEIWAYPNGDMQEVVSSMTEEDLAELADLGWSIDLELEGFGHMV